jgi:hypothetical protein
MSGRAVRAGAAREVIELTLHPYEATVILLSEAELSESEHQMCAQILTTRCH